MNYAANAYAKTARSALTPREAESAVLLKASQQLIAASHGIVTGDVKRLNEALQFNQRVWTLLASDATAADNPLPTEIKQGIGNLGVYVLRTCVDTMIAPTQEKITNLVAINNEIAAGLQGNPV